MKKIIRWLSDLFGVSKDIKKETYEEIGHILLNDRHWFVHGKRIHIHNAFTLYGMRFLYKHNAPNVSTYRDRLDEIGENRIDEFEPINYL